MLNMLRPTITRTRFLATTLTVFVAFGAARLSAQEATWASAEIIGCDRCVVTNLHFFTLDQGWAAARIGGEGQWFLLRTDDGGVTWNTQPITEREYTIYERAQFINAVEGWSPADIYDGVRDYRRTDYHNPDEDNSLFAPVTFYKTVDGGNSWTLESGEITDIEYMGDVALAQEADRRYFARVRFLSRSVGVLAGFVVKQPERETLAAYRGYTMAVTRDGGVTWKLFAFGDQQDCTWEPGLTPDPVQLIERFEDHLWAPAETCQRILLFRSPDAGLSWNVVDIYNVPQRFDAYVKFVSATEGWAWSPLSKTTDGGTTWTRHSTFSNAWGVEFISPDEGWAVGRTPAETQTVVAPSFFGSIDGGDSWNREAQEALSVSELIYDRESKSIWTLAANGHLWSRSILRASIVSPIGKLTTQWGQIKSRR